MRVPKRGQGTERPVVGTSSAKAEGPKGSRHPASSGGQPKSGRSRAQEAKPFEISKRIVWEAYETVKKKGGAAGVDLQSVEDFEKDLKNNLYKIWNRMSSGTYFPPPVRRVWIEKRDGGRRPLGIPTVADRIAQTIVKRYLEPMVEPHFDADSYGYRPGKSAIEAVGTARKRCWRYDWTIDLDVRAFFDSLDHSLAMRAVKRFTSCPWILLYIERWLKAPVQEEDGTVIARERGVPQGGVVSPLIANVFLHLAFDSWMRKEHPDVPFERYADDIIAHCRSEAHAQDVLRSIGNRLAQCKLELHPEKTRIVYCKDDDRRGSYPNEKFDFLGYTFRPRRSKNRWGKFFINFSPAVSNEAATRMRREMRRWRIHARSDKTLSDLARMFDRTLRGWINYYGRFYPSALHSVFRHLNRTLGRWARRKYKRLRRHHRRADHWIGRIARRDPKLFAHWDLLGLRPAAG